MNRRAIVIGLVMCVSTLQGGRLLSAQDHAGHGQPAPPAPSGGGAGIDDSGSIFCPTMKTGQLCTHGSANNLGLADAKVDEWREVARKYNRAVDAATEQLLKDAEGILTAEQLSQLRGWFAKGLNPEINQLLYAKGLGKK